MALAKKRDEALAENKNDNGEMPRQIQIIFSNYLKKFP